MIKWFANIHDFLQKLPKMSANVHLAGILDFSIPEFLQAWLIFSFKNRCNEKSCPFLTALYIIHTVKKY